MNGADGHEAKATEKIPVADAQSASLLEASYNEKFRWRFAWGKHTYPSRTRFLCLHRIVKTQAADGTMLETIWESRWLPETF